MEKNEKGSLRKIRTLLEEIQEKVNKIEELDPFGDMVENFEDHDGTRVTRRLIDMIDESVEKANVRVEMVDQIKAEFDRITPNANVYITNLKVFSEEGLILFKAGGVGFTAILTQKAGKLRRNSIRIERS